MDPFDIFTKLQSQYNTISLSLLDRDRFMRQTTEIALHARNRDDFLRLLEEQRRTDATELLGRWERTAKKLAIKPELFKTDHFSQWGTALRLWNTKSFEALVGHFANVASRADNDPDSDSVTRPPPPQSQRGRGNELGVWEESDNLNSDSSSEYSKVGVPPQIRRAIVDLGDNEDPDLDLSQGQGLSPAPTVVKRALSTTVVAPGRIEKSGARSRQRRAKKNVEDPSASRPLRRSARLRKKSNTNTSPNHRV
ncbi:hypothetical protein PG984_012112 [Apiospora sp. TS-2023a]